MNYLSIVGAQRSGSTFLYEALDSHPHVSMARPLKPEPKFFLNNHMVNKGRVYYEATYFPERTPETIYLGEKSTSYMEKPEAAKRIKWLYPDARILMILRDPVARAYSNYKFSVVNKLENLEFGEALMAESQRLKDANHITSVTPFAYRTRGHYVNYINFYLKIFEPRFIKILILEEIVDDISRIQEVYRWLGLDDQFDPPSINEVVNPTPIIGELPRAELLQLALSYKESIAKLENLLGRRIDKWHEQHKSYE